ncbi:hypothetical protein K7I13_03530 [Brucepastera parasyntrophica]|uniref:hypothetical protein n=1 Tax=Brucepastera parasyntrophica TaxID=2880008 RepID=UPI00210A455E|nr:hypothetical protein [Brucepastera parasyntrophica]ULQ60391.1 hypothetical protein K7I13_03530 [Brucepastera parasyntrophica]
MATTDTTQIPNGNSQLVIDKIGLRIKTEYLNKDTVKDWQKGRITILTHGETAQINIHPEFEPWEKNLGWKCLDAVLVLLHTQAFTRRFSFCVYTMYKTLYPYLLRNDMFISYFLSNFMSLAEFELAFDFYDYPLLISPSNTEHHDFKNYKGTFYSLDGKVTRRKRNGKMLSKGNQQSAVIIYDRGKKLGSDRKCTRFEVRYQGKYRKYLSINMLEGTAEKAFSLLKPSFPKIIGKLISPESIVLTDYWDLNSHELFKMMLLLAFLKK